MIFLLYLITASAVVWFSVLASKYIDMIDRSTKLSGAFLGGVLLSAVTSLPELFTSISATILLDQPQLCMGNILGSNLFNFAMLAMVILIFLKSFSAKPLMRSHTKVMLLLLMMYALVAMNWGGALQQNIVMGSDSSPLLYVSITSLLILALYFLSVRYLACDDGSECEMQEADNEPIQLSVRAIIIRFLLTSIGIIIASILLTYITDDIASQYNLGSGLAGAIFLGVATSLPEVTSTISLFRMRSFNIAFGNIAGSNVFNFFVLAVADILYVGHGVYDFGDFEVVKLALFGMVASLLMLFTIITRTRVAKIVLSLATIGCYMAFLLLNE